MQRAIDQLQKDLAASKVAEGRLQTEARQASQAGNVECLKDAMISLATLQLSTLLHCSIAHPHCITDTATTASAGHPAACGSTAAGAGGARRSPGGDCRVSGSTGRGSGRSGCCASASDGSGEGHRHTIRSGRRRRSRATRGVVSSGGACCVLQIYPKIRPTKAADSHTMVRVVHMYLHCMLTGPDKLWCCSTIFPADRSLTHAG